MGLIEQQRALARLYTDKRLRDRFHGSPVEVAKELGLSVDEALQFSAMPREQLEYFAASLVNKRQLEVSSLLPLTAAVIGSERFGALFRDYADTYIPTGVKKHSDDALAFARFLETHPSTGTEEGGQSEIPLAEWLLDLVRFERARLLATNPRRRSVIAIFRTAVHKTAEQVAAGNPNPTITKCATIAMWCRPTPQSRQLHRVFSLG